MTGTWIAVAVVVALVVLAVIVTLPRRRGKRRGRPVTEAVIVGRTSSTSLDDSTGAVRSVQTADLFLSADALEQIWSPEHLERLARTYWRFLSRVTLGLIHVCYSEHGRSIVLLARPVKLLTFHPPEYEMDSLRGLVRWRIARGLLVARRGRDGGGYLQIEVRRDPGETATRADPGETATHADPGETAAHADPGETAARAHLHVEVEVANFYPSIASGLSRRIYDVTQSRIHVIITHGFLRSLQRLDLAESRVGRFAA